FCLLYKQTCYVMGTTNAMEQRQNKNLSSSKSRYCCLPNGHNPLHHPSPAIIKRLNPFPRPRVPHFRRLQRNTAAMPPVRKGKRVQLHKELDAFLDASNTDQASIDAISKYLQSRADEYGTIVEKLLPADEIEERLRIARKIQAEIWDGI